MRSSNRQREGGQKCSSLGCHFQLVQREGLLILLLLVRGKVRTFVEENEQEKLGCCGICGFLYVYKFTLFISLIYSEKLIHFFFCPPSAARSPFPRVTDSNVK